MQVEMCVRGGPSVVVTMQCHGLPAPTGYPQGTLGYNDGPYGLPNCHKLAGTSIAPNPKADPAAHLPSPMVICVKKREGDSWGHC